uniref:EGF-like domain-containing protein n=1 Tax=Cyprinodon variegatus TaxID=28743 RepID=A0A3Q2DX06_CYPVA
MEKSLKWVLVFIPKRFCSNTTLLKTQMACHSCSISKCSGLEQRTSWFGPTDPLNYPVCRYHMKTSSGTDLTISGCSFECEKEVQVKRCCPGFWGPDCMECPDRADRPCSSRGVCSDGLGGNGTCISPVRDRHMMFFVFLVSECKCVHGLCSSGLKGDGRCTCFSGYKGPSCDQELPECAALGCQQNSRCMEEALSGRLVCQCLPGFEKSGAQCLSKNPCLQRVCHAQASCLHTGPNQHLCACNKGYTGDGRICMPVNPCQTKNGGCSPESANCVYDGPGQSHCECLQGFKKLADGSCNLKDICKPNSCHQNANCTTVGPDQLTATYCCGSIHSPLG